MTRSFALNVATGGTAESERRAHPADPARAAGPGGRAERDRGHRHARLARRPPADLRPVGRGDWTLRALESWRTVLTAMAPTAGRLRPRPPGDDLTATLDDEDPGGLGGLLGQWATAIGPMFFGLQVGSVVGHLSQRTLGQYPLAMPWAPSDELFLVTANIATFAGDWSLPDEEALVWVCARELASNSVLTRPVRAGWRSCWPPGRLLGVAQQDLAGRSGPGRTWRGGGPGWTSNHSRACSATPRPSWATCSPRVAPLVRPLTALAVVIDGYADHVAAGGHQAGRLPRPAGRGLVPAPHRTGQGRGGGRGAVRARPRTARRSTGAGAFISGVVERAGRTGWPSSGRRPATCPPPPRWTLPGCGSNGSACPNSTTRGLSSTAGPQPMRASGSDLGAGVGLTPRQFDTRLPPRGTRDPSRA